ncbi:YceI family protein [Streptomyces viridochromogenes DSM 40736]|uniref:YceI family protein n=1 Tax=Streptomyces viridochromogenes (strain DSM 40736 / JCM 4977 / BCRC 1201 / Tue 494) TaxID=591159 RepID=D9X5U1_STRVT|nr:YceI family protein [Streptomyces viridochromogenes]EFL36072.1 YceI family protein [Streptomyces viridochromogenes DSM 40736]
MALALLRRRWLKGTPAAAAGLALPLPSGAGAVTREVVDPMGTPLAAADVTVTALDTHRVAARGITDPYGYFLAALPPGRYSLMIAAQGLQPHRETIEISMGVPTPTERVWLRPAEALQLPAPGNWLFDPPHTAIRFIAKHVGMAHVHGRFERFDGGIQIAQDMSESRVSVRIDASSITTGNTTRDNHLRSGDFLDVERFPYIDFNSTRFAYRGGSKWSLLGSLTMHGVSRSVSLDTTYLGTVNGGYGQELRCAALATAELHREDFTLNWRSMLARGIAVVGPTVQLELDVQAMYRTHDTPTPPE